MVSEPFEQAQHALDQGQWQLASDRFQALLELERTPDALFALATATWWLGDMPGTVDHLEEAYAGFRRRDDALFAAATAIRLAFHSGLHLGNPAAARGWLARATRLVDEHTLEPLRGELCLTQSCLADEPKLATEAARRALDLGRAARDPDLELCALGQLGASLVEQGEIGEGIALLEEAMAGSLGGEPRNIGTVAFTSCVTMLACARCADFERARCWVEATERFAARHGSPYHTVECRVVHAQILLATGDWAAAETALETALGQARGRLPQQHAIALVTLAELRLCQGRLEEAGRLIEGLQVARAGVPVAARLELARGKPALAVAIAARRLEAIGSECLESGALLEVLGEAEIAQAEFSAAAERGRRLASLGERLGCAVLAARGERLSGHASLLAGEALGRSALERALERFSLLRMRYEAARTRSLLGLGLTALEAELAASEVCAALREFEALGAVADADQCRALLRELGVAPARPSGVKVALGELTRREREVFALLGQGCSNPEIARRLFVSRKTVEHHVAHILDKLGLRNRAEAAAEAVRTSLP